MTSVLRPAPTPNPSTVLRLMVSGQELLRRSFRVYRWKEEATCRTAQSALAVPGGLSSSILTVLRTINLQYRVP